MLMTWEKFPFQGFSCLILFGCMSMISTESNVKDYLKREHSVTKPYNDDRWDFSGTTIVTNNYIRLTADEQSRQGGIWNKIPCYMKDWELHVHFKVHGKGSDLYGDGFAVWFTRDRMELGPVFGGKEAFVGLGVFLDTYNNQAGVHNHAHPYISAMINNGTLRYDHDKDGTQTELAGCESRFRGNTHETYMAVRYELNTLTVSLDIDGQNTWQRCFSVPGIRLPTGYFFGASAETGDLSDNHDIISMKLYDIGVERTDDDGIDYRLIVPSADNFVSPRDHVDGESDSSKGSSSSGGGGWSTLFIVMLVLLLLCGCGGAAYFYYVKTHRKSRLY